MGFLRNRNYVGVTLLLLAQIGLLYSFSKDEVNFTTRPLKSLPQELGSWRMVRETQIETEVEAVLKADDTLSRVYLKEGTVDSGSLFIAFFKTQRAGVAPHSPKVCLPGAGWTPSETGVLTVPVETQPTPIEVNRYVIARGEQKSLVLYWYQTHNRAVASEYEAKFYTIADSIRYRRSDTSLVRVIVPVVDGNEEKAEAAAVEFIQSFYRPLKAVLPA
jgi:EpsI family protein